MPTTESTTPRRRAVFLDRDGTLNAQIVAAGKPLPPQTLAEFKLLPGVVEGCEQLKAAGFLLVVATNQPDVGRGTQSRELVESMHQQLCRWLPIDRVEACYDADDRVGSGRRKPQAGMVLDAARKLGIDLSHSWIIGDRWRDVDCGARAGVRTIFIDFGYEEELRAAPDFVARDFSEAVGIVLANSGPR